MALVGTIKDFGLADILQLIGLQRKTGILTLENESDTVNVKFLEGSVVGADTSLRNLEDLLGSVLVRTGRISQAQLREALQLQKSTLQRLGYVLVKQNFISSTDLEEALRVQVTQIVYRLFRWREGKYQFAPMDHMEYDNEHFRPLSAETILMEGARMIDEWPMLERRIKSPALVFRKTPAGAALDVPIATLLDPDLDSAPHGASDRHRADDEGAISPEERDILRMVDGVATVQSIVDSSAMAEFDVYRLLVDMLGRHLIEEVVIHADPEAATRSDTWTRLGSTVLQAVVIAAAALGLLSLSRNPFTPWRLATHGPETALLKTYIDRNRLERLERGVQSFYLDHGSMPESLQALAGGGYLQEDDIVDPWGRSYSYRVGPSAYEIGSRPPEGVGDEIVIRHPFSASQRMVLEGSPIDRGRAIRP
jgi:hypothetical protein